MADKARKWTDHKLLEMERKLSTIYADAKDGIIKKWNDYMDEQDAHVKDLQEAYYTAKNAGYKDEAKRLGKKLGIEKKKRTLQNQYYKDMVEIVTKKIADVNKIALAYVSDQLPEIYVKNFNQIKTVASNIGISFSLVDENTVKRLVKDGKIELPKKKIHIHKDMRWNTKQLNSAVLQGILQGESMEDIAKRILPIINNNEKSAIRNARTMVTGAENKGRVDSYVKMQESGVVMKQEWIATPDSRVRDWHLSMDGQQTDVDGYFTDGLGNKLKYPGDPHAPGNTVYNCRCSLRGRVIGFKKKDGRIEYINREA